MLAVAFKLASDIDRSVEDIVSFAGGKGTLQLMARGAVYARYPGSASLIEHFEHVDYVGPVIVAICACEYDVDPVQAVRANLSGETRYLEEG